MPSAAQHAKSVAAAEPLDALKGADALVILTPWPQYRAFAPAAIAAAMRGRVVLDPYRVLDAEAARAAGSAASHARPRAGRDLGTIRCWSTPTPNRKSPSAWS